MAVAAATAVTSEPDDEPRTTTPAGAWHIAIPPAASEVTTPLSTMSEPKATSLLLFCSGAYRMSTTASALFMIATATTMTG